MNPLVTTSLELVMGDDGQQYAIITQVTRKDDDIKSASIHLLVSHLEAMIQSYQKLKHERDGK
jgi:hypothetical protein